MSTIIQKFTSSSNLSILWNVLLEELNVNLNNKQLITTIKTIFDKNIDPFIKFNHRTNNIIELNKIFLSQVLLAVDKLIPNLKYMKKITISDEVVTNIEDVHVLRQKKFENELEQRKYEMESYLTPQKPNQIDFSFSENDGKIKEMDSLIADKLTQRNKDIEHINHTNNNDVQQWLTPSETSIKPRQTHVPVQKLTISNVIEKHVSWSDEQDTPPSSNIFLKLKKADPEPLLKEKQYEEQESTPLPQQHKNKSEFEPVVLNDNTQKTSIIPKNDIVEQLNEINHKINDIYSAIEKLTTLINDKLTNVN
jgi:hypothetical protein